MGQVIGFMPKEIRDWMKSFPFLGEPEVSTMIDMTYTYTWDIGSYIVYYDLDKRLDMARMSIWKKGGVSPLRDTLSVSEERKECIKTATNLLKIFDTQLRFSKNVQV